MKATEGVGQRGDTGPVRPTDRVGTSMRSNGSVSVIRRLYSLRFCDSLRPLDRHTGSRLEVKSRIFTFCAFKDERKISSEEVGSRPLTSSARHGMGGDACERPTLRAQTRPEATHSIPVEAGRHHHVISECSQALPQP